MGVLGFICVRWVRSGAPWGSSGSLGSFGRALGIVRLIRVHWARPGGRRVYSLSLASFGCAMGVVVFIRVVLDASTGGGVILALPVGRWVHSGAPG